MLAVFKDLQNKAEKLYLMLYGLILGLLVVPWVFYIENEVRYSFLPRRILFAVFTCVAVLIILLQRPFPKKKIWIALLFASLGILHWQLKKYLEPHYFLQFTYMEMASLVFLAPDSIKEKVLKWSSILLYLFLAKALYYRMGTYIHGGLLSSNLYGTYIVYLCFLEVARRRYWNLIPAFVVIFYVGSKACYLASLVVILAAIYQFFKDRKSDFSVLRFCRTRIEKGVSFYWPLAIATVFIAGFTAVMLQTKKYQDWSKSMEGSKAETTQNNLIMYGVNQNSAAAEEDRKHLLKKIEGQFNENKMSLQAPPLITDVGMSMGLRVAQYSHVFQNLHLYFFVGDANKAQAEMYGHNPHSAVPDIISRLGLLYLILILVFYSSVFKSMNLFFFNLGILPILSFQPYGFTIGHSIVLLSVIYTLTKYAEVKSLKPQT